MLYTVKWEIEVDAKSSHAAALKAMSMMPRDLGDPEDGATVFEVTPWYDSNGPDLGRTVFIDIAEEEGD